MSACPPLSFRGVRPEAWVAIKAAVAANYHFVVYADQGSGAGGGFVLSWAFDAATGNLTVTCLDSPWWAGCVLINDEINNIIAPLV